MNVQHKSGTLWCMYIDLKEFRQTSFCLDRHIWLCRQISFTCNLYMLLPVCYFMIQSLVLYVLHWALAFANLCKISFSYCMIKWGNQQLIYALYIIPLTNDSCKIDMENTNGDKSNFQIRQKLKILPSYISIIHNLFLERNNWMCFIHKCVEENSVNLFFIFLKWVLQF